MPRRQPDSDEICPPRASATTAALPCCRASRSWPAASRRLQSPRSARLCPIPMEMGDAYGQGRGYRPGDDQLGDRGPGGWRPDGDRQRGRIPHDPLGGGLHRPGRAAGRAAGPAAGHPQPERDDHLGQAVHRPPLRRGGERGQGGLLRRRGRPGRHGPLRRARQAVRAGGDQRPGAAQAGRGRRQVPGRAGHQGGDHRPGLLQRRPAPGDQGRRQDRRARSLAHHQRADGSRPGLRARQARARDRAGVRPRRRHLRRQPA